MNLHRDLARYAAVAAQTDNTSVAVSCDYKNGEWVCTTSNGVTVAVEGKAFVKALREGVSRTGNVRHSSVRMPVKGRGKCIVTTTYRDGSTKVVRGTCRPAQRRVNPGLYPGRARGKVKKCPRGQVWSASKKRCVPHKISLGGGGDPLSGAGRRRRMSANPAVVTKTLVLPTKSPTSSPQTGMDDCCFDADLMLIVCEDPNNPLNGQVVVKINGIDANTGMASIQIDGIDEQGNLVSGVPPITLRLPVCGTGQTPPEEDETQWCYDEKTGVLMGYDGSRRQVGANTSVFTRPNGTRYAVVSGAGDEAPIEAPLCLDFAPPGDRPPTKPPGEKPPAGTLPPDCCYDPVSQTVVCSDGSVRAISRLEAINGNIATVYLADGQGYRVPLCPPDEKPPLDTLPPDCCYDPVSQTVVCSDGTVHQVSWLEAINENLATVYLADGKGYRVPLCPPGDKPPGDEECYCCVDIDTMTYVCPDKPGLHGTAADVADVQDDGTYVWVILVDGTRLPACGEDCPPCPPAKCPPSGGDCPTCPPGWLLNTQTGECVQCPTCPTCPDCGGKPPGDDCGPCYSDDPCDPCYCSRPFKPPCCNQGCTKAECDGACLKMS